MTQQLIEQLQNCYSKLQTTPSIEEISSYIRQRETTYVKNFVTKLGKIRKKAKQNARTRAHKKFMSPVNPIYCADLYQDGWQHRYICHDNTNHINKHIHTFIYKGYVVKCKYSYVNREITSLIEIEMSVILKLLLDFINVILHLNEHNCEFDENFLKDKLSCAQAFLSTQYANYIPIPPKMRRSYNCDLYNKIANITVLDGWQNREICDFNEHISVLKLGEKKYVVDCFNGKIDRIERY